MYRYSWRCGSVTWNSSAGTCNMCTYDPLLFFSDVLGHFCYKKCTPKILRSIDQSFIGIYICTCTCMLISQQNTFPDGRGFSHNVVNTSIHEFPESLKLGLRDGG